MHIAISALGRQSRRRILGTGATLAGSTALSALSARSARAVQRTPDAVASPTHLPDPATIAAIVREIAERDGLRAGIYRVVVDGAELVTDAFGESMDGVPATVDMHVRNGAVAIGYLATLVLQLVDEGVIGLDDTIDAWLPDLPEATTATLRMLLNMTAGYPDYVPNPDCVREVYANPFRIWTADELIAYGLARPRLFAPGENWDYSHTNVVILGQALEAITGQPLADVLRARVLDPLGLTNTISTQTSAISDPPLHAFSSERKLDLGIAPATRFYEESTFWNPSWTLAPGAVMTTDIFDMTATAIEWGEGTLLSPQSHAAMIEPRLIGFGSLLDGCANCHPLDEIYSYGLGVVLSNGWVLQNPRFGGYIGVAAYLPTEKIAIAVTATFGEDGFDEMGDYRSVTSSTDLLKAIAGTMTSQAPFPG